MAKNNGNPWKKRNPERPAETFPGPAQPAQPEFVMPALRTFILRQTNQLTGEKTERTIEAHGLGVDESRMISFIVFFYPDPQSKQPGSSTKLALNSEAWDEVEEVNELFPVRPKGLFH